ncbi:MAG: [FeFe] hydrogenase H-cluster maturation GTPase HydF [Fusobacteriaceae bacterium]
MDYGDSELKEKVFKIIEKEILKIEREDIRNYTDKSIQKIKNGEVIMQNTPNSNRKHIGIFGKTNSGKSSLLNCIIEQDLAIVSDTKGTTTDSVVKAMELLPYGPVLFIDTAGLDDSGILGDMRVQKALSEIKRCDLALFLVSGEDLDFNFYHNQVEIFKKYNLSHMLIISKDEFLSHEKKKEIKSFYPHAHFVSANRWESTIHLKEEIIKSLEKVEEDPSLLGDILPYGSTVVMVVPIDSEAPKGRLILPQVQLLRDCLDNGIKSYVVRDTELETALLDLKNIDLIITDSQAFQEVDTITNGRFPLTSFSILFARQKGELCSLVHGAKTIDSLLDGANILIAETCTHNTSHEDIGRVKIPNLLRKKTGKNFNFHFKMGNSFPENLNQYDLIVHCGACMINRKNMQNRIDFALEKNIPITNYGLLIAQLNGILDKSIEIFKK